MDVLHAVGHVGEIDRELDGSGIVMVRRYSDGRRIWLNEYQITESKLEFRALDGKGRPFPDQRSAWRRLTARELVLHFKLETAVAHWFLEKTAAWDSETAQQELRKAA